MTRPVVITARKRLSTFIHHSATEVVIILLIIASVALLIAEYSFSLTSEQQKKLVLGEQMISMVFAAELSVRYYVARKKSRFFRRYWPDILAILPLMRPLRFIRLVRLFRLFRLGLLLSRRVALFRGIVRVNVYELWVLLVITLIIVTGASVMAYVFEPRAVVGFGSLEESFWWALNSLIAAEPVGGMPTTLPGRLVTVGLMLSGMSLFAVFTGVVSATVIDRLSGREGSWEMDLDELEDHIVVCGWNDAVPPLLAEISEDRDLCNLPIVLITTHEQPPLQHAGVQPELLYVLKGDHAKLQVLQSAGIERASRAVVVADSLRGGTADDRDARTVLAALTIEKLKPGIYCAVELMDQSNESHLRVAGVEAVVTRNDLSGRALAAACRHPDLVNVIMELVSLHRGKTMTRVAGPDSPTAFGELVERIKRADERLVLGIEVDGAVVVNPASKQLVRPEDWLIVIDGDQLGA